MVVICPLTSACPLTRLYPSDVLVKAPEGGLQVDSVVLTLQVRATDVLQDLHALEARLREYEAKYGVAEETLLFPI
ncbi:MAG: hypothetical protein ACE5I2_06440 [Anaerolineae bacterium]